MVRFLVFLALHPSARTVRRKSAPISQKRIAAVLAMPLPHLHNPEVTSRQSCMGRAEAPPSSMRSEKAIGRHKGGFHVRGQCSAATNSCLAPGLPAPRLRPVWPSRSRRSSRAARGSRRRPRRRHEPFVTLTALEAAFIVAAVDTLIPADELSPSGSDCGVAIFIDRQLGSAWGGGAKMYRAGPFVKGKPEQGYQLALTPREFFAAGITAANAWARKTYRQGFRPPRRRPIASPR